MQAPSVSCGFTVSTLLFHQPFSIDPSYPLYLIFHALTVNQKLQTQQESPTKQKAQETKYTTACEELGRSSGDRYQLLCSSNAYSELGLETGRYKVCCVQTMIHFHRFTNTNSNSRLPSFSDALTHYLNLIVKSTNSDVHKGE